MADRGDNVVRRHGFPVVKLQTGPELEIPCFEIGGRVEGLGQVTDGIALDIDDAEGIGPGAPERIDGIIVRIGRGVQGVGGGPRTHREPEMPALLWLGAGRADKSPRDSGAESGAGAGQEAAPADLSLRFYNFIFQTHVCSPVFGLLAGIYLLSRKNCTERDYIVHFNS